MSQLGQHLHDAVDAVTVEYSWKKAKKRKNLQRWFHECSAIPMIERDLKTNRSVSDSLYT